jgi:hypothetical protein
MKLYLAAYMEPENHGPGRKISISDTKPKDFEVNSAFTFFIPAKHLINNYRENQLNDQVEASNKFTNGYSDQLKLFFDQVKNDSKSTGQSVQELLPFRDGDTLLCWERKGFRSYRTILARFLEDAGYEVEL